MGNISSRPDDGSALYLKDQTRLSIASLTISNTRRNVTLTISPNAFPATRLMTKRSASDEAPASYIQDPELSIPSYILKLEDEDDLEFRFSFTTRQAQAPNAPPNPSPITGAGGGVDTAITGLTFAFASTARELDNLVTREFHADPNIHKNSNVQLVGDYSTNGSPAIHYDWSWKWRPPKPTEDRGRGWRNSCSFLEYDQRAHRLNTLASFSFWVQNTLPPTSTPLASPGFELLVPPVRQRMPSSQSYQSAASDSEGFGENVVNPPSPLAMPTEFSATSTVQIMSNHAAPTIDIACPRPGDDMSAVEDGPLFRATMKSLEQKTGNMRTQIKKVLKKAEAAQAAQSECNLAMRYFLSALQEASASNASAFKPALDHYFNHIAQQILRYETQNSTLLKNQIIDPLSRLYNLDIKQAEAKKKDFEDESRDYYAYVSRYLGQRQDSLKEKKRAESDSKYQTKRRNYELKRFDYSSFMQDLHGGRKEQELLSQLTKYADGQAKSFLGAAKKVEGLVPQLDALVREVSEADKEYQLQRTEREEKRRNLERSTTSYTEPDAISHPPPASNAAATAAAAQSSYGSYVSDTELSRADSTGSQLGHSASTRSSVALSPSNSLSHTHSNLTFSMSPGATAGSPAPNRFKGIRDLEDKEGGLAGPDRNGSGQHKKEGLLWALSRPGSHIDPKGINKQAWHKFWIVLDQGKLSEYSNWKQKLDLHMEPIDLRMASVRTARDADRRFCFEVITPHFKRIYQATSEDDMSNWITAINNALQSAVEGRGSQSTPQRLWHDSPGRDMGSALTGRASSHSGPHGSAARGDSNGVNRRITVGARPSYIRTNSNSYEENPSKLLDQVRSVDQGNAWCADCGSTAKVEWVSINLGIILCIECSGMHRSLGTHISKIRSLTLDTLSFTNDIVELLLLVGNRVSNMIWEASLDPSQKLAAHASREQRLQFITAKYAERAYVQPITTALSHFATADETLLASVKKNDVQGVLYGIALRGNVNATDRSRGTHAVFLALAAADPAAPASAAPSPAVSPSSKAPAGSAPGAMPKAFPIAELLIQNGAEVPVQLPAIPLSAAARLYIEQRTARTSGVGPGGVATGAGDMLGPLPTMTRGGPGGGGLFSSSGAPDREREPGKLQKRGSAGSRFAGKVASLARESVLHGAGEGGPYV